MSIQQFLSKTDFVLLAKQKSELVELLNQGVLPEDKTEALDGLLNFLDNYQDLAVEAGIPEEEVFPVV